MTKHTRRATVSAVAALLLCAPAIICAQAFPVKPIRVLVGFAPGGGADTTARIIARGLTAELSQQVIVENRPGADGILAAQEVMRALPDGSTLLLGTSTSMVAVPALRPNPPYDPFKNFTPLSTAGESTMFLVASPSLPGKTAIDVLDHIAANPGKYNSGSSSQGAELALLQVLSHRNAKVVNARYKGDMLALTDLVGGHIQLVFATGTLTPALVNEGKARALLTLLPHRSPLLPDVPTAAELGLSKVSFSPWAGFFGPAGMPVGVADRLSGALRAALSRADVSAQLAGQGFHGYGMSSGEFAAFFRKQYDGYVTTVREHNLRFE